MIEQFLVMDASGITLYSWSATPTDKDSNLISGFFTALNVFAESERGENIKKINLSMSTFLFERVENLIFVIITSDSEFEKLILPILTDIKNQFLKQFNHELKAFSGDITPFNQFNQTVQEILHKYGYLNLIRMAKEFKFETQTEALLVIDRISGDFLLSKAKSYLDRKTLGFLANIVVKSGTRLMTDILQQNILQIFIITLESKCLIIESFEKTIIIQERMIPIDVSKYILSLDAKKIQSRIKKPGSLLFEVDQQFHLFDGMGHNYLSNQSVHKEKQNEIIADAVTLMENSKSIVNQIFKGTYFTTLFTNSQNIFSILSLTDNYGVFMAVNCSQTVLDNITHQNDYCKEISTQDWSWTEEIFRQLKELQKKF